MANKINTIMKKKLLFMSLICAFQFDLNAQLKDVDGNLYPIVKIGNQTWMSENLSVSHFKNGEIIPLAKSELEFEQMGKLKKPGRIIKNGEVQYNWYAVNDNRGLAPLGWHVPHLIEWETLLLYAEDIDKLKSTSGWSYDGNGTNEFGFNAKAGDGGECSFWWTASEIEMTDPKSPKVYAHVFTIMANLEGECFISNPFKSDALCVRCLKDVIE